MATRHNIVIPQAGTYRLVVLVADGPTDLSGYTAQMQIRPAKGSVELYAEVTGITVEPVNRQVIVEMTDEQTGAMNWLRDAPYDLYIEGPAGDRWRLLEGLATLSKTVTREA